MLDTLPLSASFKMAKSERGQDAARCDHRMGFRVCSTLPHKLALVKSGTARKVFSVSSFSNLVRRIYMARVDGSSLTAVDGGDGAMLCTEYELMHKQADEAR
jgi:hypothetical protein